MKVMKFGGSSVGSVESLKNVKRIVESQEEPVIVVVSALGGVTDKLIQLSALAEKGVAACPQGTEGGRSYTEGLEELKARHLDVMRALISDSAKYEELLRKVDRQFARLGELLNGISLLHIFTERISDEVVSFGERISSNIVAALIDGAERFNSLDFVRTEKQNGRNVPDFSLTGPLVRKTFANAPKICVVPGFIARDRDSGIITTLGRGGSDYTASILAAELDADILEIWTDVNGFMTADPRVISSSYVINELSYQEAMELCNFGAKVIYPPTLHPVRARNIPILIKNTFNPEAPGSIIKEKCDNAKSITGISSINNICILTLSGNSMLGVVGIDKRLFGRLADSDISVFMISQAISETGVSVGIEEKNADLAYELLNKEFADEIALGSIDPVKMMRGLATIGIVGDNMFGQSGLAGRVFTTLGRNNISIIACAQDSDESNISFVIEGSSLRKALNVIHENFFFTEYQILNVFVCGTGTVGGRLLEQISSRQEWLQREKNLKLNVVGIARSSRALFDREGIDLSCWRERMEKEGTAADVRTVRDRIIEMNPFNSVFVDCTASEDVAGIYSELFEHRISVVAANKIAASSLYGNYRMLKESAGKNGARFRFETNVGAGLPVIGTINNLVNSGDRILRIEAVLSGTLNFIFNALSEDISFSKAVRMAMEQGFSEPDPRTDLSGKDVIRKLVILAREAGYEVEQDSVEAKLFIPEDMFECSQEEFWKRLPSLDAGFGELQRRLDSEHRKLRFVAGMELGKCSVSLQEVGMGHPFYNLEGSNNAVLLTTDRYREHPMLIQGYGAGADVTAAGVFADILSIADI